jgi:hypothetical protein
MDVEEGTGGKAADSRNSRFRPNRKRTRFSKKPALRELERT